MTSLSKLKAARCQVGTALELFIRDRDPVSVQCLACGGGELIEAIAHGQSIVPLSSHILETVPDIDLKALRAVQRKYWNAFKHMSDRLGNVRDDEETLSQFSDVANDAALFVGWWDYYEVAGTLPVEAQVFQLWWYALYEVKLAAGTDLAAIRRAFPAIGLGDRAEHKRRLRRAVEKYRGDRRLLFDPKTEIEPLVVRAHF